jgi:hypothetical protein
VPEAEPVAKKPKAAMKLNKAPRKKKGAIPERSDNVSPRGTVETKSSKGVSSEGTSYVTLK